MEKFICLLLTLVFLCSKTKSEALFATISGNITSEFDSVKLRVAIEVECAGSLLYSGKKWMYPLVDKSGSFSFTLPALNHPYRMFFIDDVSHTIFYDFGLIEPGDRITMIANIKGLSNESNIHFSGLGSEKYNCYQKLELISKVSTAEEATFKMRIHDGDSLTTIKLAILSHFRRKLKSNIYEIIKADVVGQVKYNILTQQFSDILYNRSDTMRLIPERKMFYQFISDKKSLDNFTLSQSKEYIKYLYAKEKINLLILNKGRNISFKQLYLALRAAYQGKLREQLLAFCVLNYDDIIEFFGECDPNEYKWCLEDVIKFIRSIWLRKPLCQFLNTRTKGAKAFDFALPADSTLRLVHLSDFKGKIVLLDIWSYQCTGCYQFAKAFHEKVYPMFKNNPNFIVISIMLGESSRDGYMRRLRRLEKNMQPSIVSYTFPEYINLFGGKGEEMGRAIERHYDIGGFPFLLLVDKEGNIFSSTVPYFNDAPSKNPKKMIDVILKALGT